MTITARYFITNNNITITDVSCAAGAASGIFIDTPETYNAYIEGNNIIAVCAIDGDTLLDIPVTGICGVLESENSPGDTTNLETVKYGTNNIQGFVVPIYPLTGFTREIKISDVLKTDVVSGSTVGATVTGDLTVTGTIHNAITVPRGYIDGLKLSLYSSRIITFGAGLCSCKNNDDATLSSITFTAKNKTLINSAFNAYELWAANNAGGVAAVASPYTTVPYDKTPLTYAAQWIHCFVIMATDGTVDAGFDTSVTCVNLLLTASAISTKTYKWYRRVGSVRTRETTNAYIYPFNQYGDYFDFNSVWWDFELGGEDATGLNNNTARNLVYVPRDVYTIAKIKAFVHSHSTINEGFAIITKYSEVSIPSLTAWPFYDIQVSVANPEIQIFDIPTTPINVNNYIQVRTGLSSTGVTMWIVGYHDFRGKDGF